MNEYTRVQTGQDLDNIFDTLCLATVVKRSLNYLSTKVPAENIHWVLRREADLIHVEKENYKPHSKMDQSVFLTSQVELSEEDVVKRFLEFDLSTQVDKLKSDGYLCVEYKRKPQFVIPVQNFGTNEVEAYFVFTNLSPQDRSSAITKAKEIISLMTKHLQFAIEHYSTREQSFIDDVTDLYNQRYLPMVLDKEIARATREKGTFAVLFLDIDYFKAVNDTCGHLVGSQILVEISEIIKDQIRTSDFAFRYGGDEFVVLLPQTDVDKAQVVAERIREAVEANGFSIEGVPAEIKLTVSIGLSGFPQHATTSEEIIQLADDAMYLAKNKSRNTVYVTAS